MSQYLSHVWRLFITPYRGKIAVRCIANAANQALESEPHIYKKKYKTDEIIKYLKDNIAYDCRRFLVSCVPQGVHFFPKNEWDDYDKTPVFELGLQNIIPELCEAFKCENIFISKHPRRTSSGLIVLSKDFKTFQTVRYNCKLAKIRKDRIFCYLVIVLGTPEKIVTNEFKTIKTMTNNKSYLEIFDSNQKERGFVFRYRHEVIDSTEHVSLLRVTVSDDTKDIIRHTLGQKMFTPILGDSWNTKKVENALFGAPLACDPSDMPFTPYKLPVDILNKLKLKESEEKSIPICSHFYSLRLEFKKKTEVFIAVPPTDVFVWTCNQLGLKKIDQFMNSGK